MLQMQRRIRLLLSTQWRSWFQNNVCEISRIPYAFTAPALRLVRTSTSDNFTSTFLSGNALLAISWVQFTHSIGLSDSEEVQLKTLIEKAQKYLKENDEQSAKNTLNSALTLANKLQKIEYIYDVAKLLSAIALKNKEYKEAEKFLLDLLNYYDSHPNLDESEQLERIYAGLKLAEVYRNLENYTKAENLLKELCENQKQYIKKLTNEDSKQEEKMILWIQTLIEKGYYHLAVKNWDSAYEDFLEAYNMCIGFRGEISEPSVMLLKDLGLVCYQKGDLDLALEYLKKAVHHGKHLPGMEEFSSVYVSLGNIYLKQGLLIEAEMNCTEGHKNALRHNYKDGITESNNCLIEIQNAQS